ncbi:MAG: IS4 family transposase, partial [Armatimonadetes bacterium]|nr:IS4 family transposase [Armatimonadota bacterium]
MLDIGHGGSIAPVGGVADATVVLEALTRHIQPHLIDAVLHQTDRCGCRRRQLPAPMMVWLVIAMGLWGDLDIPAIWRQVMGTLRSLWRVAAGRAPPTKSALSQARGRLGARPIRQLFVHTAAPLAADTTRGAFYRGMRLMAIDGWELALPDTPANSKAFGRPATRRHGQPVAGGYPKVQVLRLMEVGTHLSVEALIRPHDHGEYPVASALLHQAPAGCLMLWDRGFYGYSLLKQAVDEHKHVLGRLKANVITQRIENLGDGSYQARIYPTAKDQRRGTNALIVRVIEYTCDDPQRPGHGQRHRLVTTLLDAALYPAKELIVLYHERWEIELANDEIVTHQLARPVELRSRTPCGVVQEIYGVLLAHNAVRALMHEAAVSVNLDPRALSFIHAVRVIRETVPWLRTASAEQLTPMYRAMIRHIAGGRLPPRDNRINPRV